jgi:HAD superfamily hydrolase (TIGR01509 family)
MDGTLAETERDGHRPAFNRAFADNGLPYGWDVAEYGRLLAITGGRRRLRHFLTERGHADADQLAAELHATKTAHFRAWVRTGPVRARPGVPELISDLRKAGVRLGVATTGRRAWVSPLLSRLFDTDMFATVVTGDDVDHLKPAPDLYLRALAKLGVRATDAMAVEDSPNGLGSALAAGLACLVVPSVYNRNAEFRGAAAVVEEFAPLDAACCAVAHERWWRDHAAYAPAR